jgi:hypothetical protein
MQTTQDNLIRPKRIAIVLTLFYISLSIWIIGYILNIKSYPPKYFWFYLANLLISSTIILFLIHMIGKGRNWARMSILLFLVVSTPKVFLETWQSTATTYIVKIYICLQLLLIIAAFILSFSKESNLWFKKVSTLSQKTWCYTSIPRNVKIAITLFYILLGIRIYSDGINTLGYAFGVAKLNMGFYPQSSLGIIISNNIMILTLIAIIGDAISFLLIYMTQNGKNWARIIILVGFIVHIMQFIRGLPNSASSISITVISILPIWVVTFIALIHLFQRESNEWFKQSGHLMGQLNR